MVETQGVGDWCLTYFSAPREWAGSSGVIQIVDNAPDGMLYQVRCHATPCVHSMLTRMTVYSGELRRRRQLHGGTGLHELLIHLPSFLCLRRLVRECEPVWHDVDVAFA